MFVPKSQNPGLAALLIVAASAFMAMATLVAKALVTDTLGPGLHPMQVSHGRFLFAFMALAGAAAVVRPRISNPNWRLHLGRSMAGWTGISLMFGAVAIIPLADATAISFLNPVFAMLLAIPLLGERVGRIRWSAAAIAMAGALILLRPTPESFQPAALIALAAAMVIGVELIFIKKLSGRESVFQILLINNLIGMSISSLAVLAVWQMPTAPQWGALVTLGLTMVCVQILFVNGMARGDASFVAPFSYATLVFAALFDLAVFDVMPDAVSVLGAGVILSGALMLVWREARLRKL